MPASSPYMLTIRCHLGVRGRDKRGDMRGMGCAAYHISYSNEGFYEGTDPAIPKDKKGHPHKKSFHDQLMERT